MAIDPRAAAAAAQAAADAARAAAEAAAAAEAVASNAAATGADAPTLATTTTQRVLEDTDVTLGTELGGDAAELAALGQEGASVEGQTRTGFAELPGLSSAIGGVGGVDLPTLEGSFSSGGGDIDKSDVASFMGTMFRAIDSVADMASAVGKWAEKTFDGPAPETAVDAGTADLDEASGGEEGKSDPDLDAGSPEAQEAADEDEANASGGTSGADAGGGTTDVPAEDAPFVPPPGWVDFNDLDFVPDERKVGGVVGGSRGADPDADDSSTGRPAPQGGDWAVNPGSEGTMYEVGRNTDLRDASAVTWVGQPAGGDEDLPEQMPAELQALDPGPGPEVINPDRGDADTADAEAEASTAYPSTAAGVDSMAAADAGPGSGMPAFDADEDSAVGAGHGRGREFGHEQGEERGHNQRDTEEV
jgi:hypothetical protein